MFILKGITSKYSFLMTLSLSIKYNPKLNTKLQCAVYKSKYYISVTGTFDNLHCLLTLSLAKYFIVVFIIKKINTLIGKPD